MAVLSNITMVEVLDDEQFEVIDNDGDVSVHDGKIQSAELVGGLIEITYK